jgi:hypothetical protein
MVFFFLFFCFLLCICDCSQKHECTCLGFMNIRSSIRLDLWISLAFKGLSHTELLGSSKTRRKCTQTTAPTRKYASSLSIVIDFHFFRQNYSVAWREFWLALSSVCWISLAFKGLSHTELLGSSKTRRKCTQTTAPTRIRFAFCLWEICFFSFDCH